MAEQVFDEEIALKRFAVALKRADWRMFDQALARLDEEIAAGSPFSRHQAWQDFLRTAGERADLPESLITHFRDALGRLLAVETRVTTAPANPEGEGAVALVLAWSDGLDEPRVRLAFKAWLEGRGATAVPTARQVLSRWLAEGASLSTLAHRANLSLAAASAGLGLADAPWTTTFYAGLAQALAAGAVPPPARLAEALAGVTAATVISADPGPAWDAVELPGLELLKLGGAIDRFACPACHGDIRVPGALAVACPACGAPAWPLIVPFDQPSWQPPAVRDLRARAAAALRHAGTWVLVDPPDPTSDALAAWLVGSLTPGKRVLVVGGPALEAWQAFLAPFQPRAVVTSRGPADQVLGFLLQGGVPELEPATGDQPPVFGAKKKKR
ncbi:MAG: hypothetical protein JWM80_3878 [Cyanobacteria bacterium RYN_339]|nr:hypothetical protein [Cyanobacteria bacterium RYN_339]